MKCEWIEDPEATPIVGCEREAAVTWRTVRHLVNVPPWVQEFNVCAEHGPRAGVYLADLLKTEITSEATSC